MSGVAHRLRFEPPRGKRHVNVFDSLGIECCESAAAMSQSSFSEVVREIATLIFEFVRVVSISIVVFEVCCLRFWLGVFRKIPAVRVGETRVYSTLLERIRIYVINRRPFHKLSSLSSSKKSDIQLVTSRSYSPQEFSGSLPQEGGVIPSGLCLLDVSVYPDFKQLMTTLCHVWKSGWQLSLNPSNGLARFGFFWDLAVDDQQPQFLVLVTAMLFSALSVARAVITTGKIRSFPIVVYYPRERDGWVFHNACWTKDANAAAISVDKSS